ncbi:MAG: hypothetical protein WCD46_03435, partial [Desulfobacterales bacterium]
MRDRDETNDVGRGATPQEAGPSPFIAAPNACYGTATSASFINIRVTVPWAIQKARNGNAGLDEDRQSRVQAGALLLPPDREFSAEEFFGGGVQFANLFRKVTKFEVELNNNLT